MTEMEIKYQLIMYKLDVVRKKKEYEKRERFLEIYKIRGQYIL